MFKLIIFLLIIFFFNSGFTQEKYWVFFNNKKGVTFEPYAYFDSKAIERRVKANIPLIDSTDFPLNENYINSVKEIVEDVTSQSRWFNAIAVWAFPEQIKEVAELSFVKDVKPIYLQTYVCSYNYKTELSEKEKKLLKNQTRRMGGDLFEENGIDGKGIRIAIFDNGFYTIDKSPVFEHIRKEGRIIKTYDFIMKREFDYGFSLIPSHGTMVFSCIAGMIDGQKMGLATGAEFLLAQTEIMREPFSEEENWLAAVEWADKNGADIINSSLGYTYHRYFTGDMDGKTSLVARAANMAARKGILVVNAMGNDGANKWKYLSTPADADSVLSVGGIDPDTDLPVSFTSFGPTADKRMKPNVSAYGEAVVAGKNSLITAQGTSFSSPLIAGFAACALQTNRSLSNMELFKEIEKSGDLYPYYDYLNGFGVPQASYFINKMENSTAGTQSQEKNEITCPPSGYAGFGRREKTFELNVLNDTLYVVVNDNFIITDSTPVARLLFKNLFKHKYLYYHIENKHGVLDKYTIINVFQKNALQIPIKEFKNNEIIRVHYKGFTDTYRFKN